MRKSLLFSSLICLAVYSFPATAEHPTADELVNDLGIRESRIASRDMPGWSRPKKVSIMIWQELPDSGVGSKEWLLEVSDGVEINIFDATEDEIDTSGLADSDVYLGWCSADAISSITKLQYIHFYAAGIDSCMPTIESLDSTPIATNSAKAASETIAEHSIAMLLALTRNLHIHHSAQLKSSWRDQNDDAFPTISIQGKTMLVLGLGGIGSQIALRANAMGMRVIATRNSSRTGPDYVEYVGLSSEMNELAAQADVVVNALPLTSSTRGIVDAVFFDSMKNGSYYISVGRGPTTDTDALIAAIESKKLHGAGLDVTDPEPLPSGHPLWSAPNVIITPHRSSLSERSSRNTWIIARENLRRYILGDKLLNQVDLERGY
jgi:D-2-hydroxyacid dehydrogenase (NADP+)